MREGNRNMPKPTAVTVTILPTSNLVFGGRLDYAVSEPITSDQSVLLQVQADAGGGLVEYAGTVNSDGLGGSFTLGPTPSWSSGSATGTIEPVTFNPQKGEWSPTKGTDPVAFVVGA